MATQTALHYLIDEIESIRPSLRLALPASAKSVRLQIGRISAAQEQLRVIEEKIYLFANRGIRSSARLSYLGLKALVSNMISDGDNYKLLAEEYFYDPEGVMLLLNELNQREAALQAHIQKLKQQTANSRPFSFGFWQAKPKERQPQPQVKAYKQLSRLP